MTVVRLLLSPQLTVNCFQFHQYVSNKAAAMIRLRVVFILVIIRSSFVLPMRILQDSSDIHVKKIDSLSHRLFKRQAPTCNEGEYTGIKHCCKNCEEGTHVESECTEPHKESACKKCTEGEDYMDKKNGSPECHKCRNCETGQEILESCKITRNTVCKCAVGFFCAKNLSSPNENCDQCRHCTKCDLGIAEPCTATKDNVCKNHYSYHPIVWPVVIVFTAIFIIGGVYIYRKKRVKEERITVVSAQEEAPAEPQISGSHDTTAVPLISVGPENTPSLAEPPKSSPTCPPHLENTDLEKHLHAIADIKTMGSVQNLVEKKLTTVQIDDCKLNHPNDVREQKYDLLKKWYSASGRIGSCKILIQNSTVGEAEKVIDLIQE